MRSHGRSDPFRSAGPGVRRVIDAFRMTLRAELRIVPEGQNGLIQHVCCSCDRCSGEKASTGSLGDSL